MHVLALKLDLADDLTARLDSNLLFNRNNNFVILNVFNKTVAFLHFSAGDRTVQST